MFNNHIKINLGGELESATPWLQIRCSTELIRLTVQVHTQTFEMGRGWGGILGILKTGMQMLLENANLGAKIRAI